MALLKIGLAGLIFAARNDAGYVPKIISKLKDNGIKDLNINLKAAELSKILGVDNKTLSNTIRKTVNRSRRKDAGAKADISPELLNFGRKLKRTTPYKGAYKKGGQKGLALGQGQGYDINLKSFLDEIQTSATIQGKNLDAATTVSKVQTSFKKKTMEYAERRFYSSVNELDEVEKTKVLRGISDKETLRDLENAKLPKGTPALERFEVDHISGQTEFLRKLGLGEKDFNQFLAAKGKSLDNLSLKDLDIEFDSFIKEFETGNDGLLNFNNLDQLYGGENLQVVKRKYHAPSQGGGMKTGKGYAFDDASHSIQGRLATYKRLNDEYLDIVAFQNKPPNGLPRTSANLNQLKNAHGDSKRRSTIFDSWSNFDEQVGGRVDAIEKSLGTDYLGHKYDQTIVDVYEDAAATAKQFGYKLPSVADNPNIPNWLLDDFNVSYKAGGGRVEYENGTGPKGVQPVASPSQSFDQEVKTMMQTSGLDIGDSVLEVMKDRNSRQGFKLGGMVGDVKLGPSMTSELDSTNKVGAAESLLAGIGAGLVDIPKGVFTLGAALMDLGAGTHNAAKVEDWFDNLNDWDDKAEQHWLGSFSRIAVNLGVPGAYGWKAGEKLATKALLAKRNGKYFRLNDPELAKRFNTALNGKGRLMATLGASGGAGVTDAIFVGDPESMGTFGDMASWGPTQLEPNDEKMASREIVNRMKFGLDGSLMIGLVGGTGSAIKTLYRRRNELSSNNDKIDKFFSAFRPRGRKSQEYFDMERRNIGARATDINWAGEQSRKLDKHIDAIFPFVKNPFNKLGNKGRTEFMKDLNDTLLSGSPIMNSIGKVDFGPMDSAKLDKIIKLMKDKGAKQSDIEGVVDSFEQMRLGWGHIFSRLGYSMDDEVRKGFSPLFGDKFKDYLGSTYELFQNKSLIPLFNYAPTEEVVEKTIKMFQESAKAAGKPITREQAEMYANQIVETAKLPSNLATSKEKTTGVFFNAPDFFANKTVLTEIDAATPTIALRNLKKEPKEIVEKLLGKVEDPMQTMLTGTNRLSLIGRRNQFYNELLKSDEALIAERTTFSKANPGVKAPDTMKGFFRETDIEAINAFGQNIKQINIDPSRTIEAGVTNPLHGKWAEKGVAEAIEESAMVARDKSTLSQMYHSFLLYPKATSQMAKTILSPVTHVRNFISAGAFASSNGLFLQNPAEIGKAMKDAYKALQIPGSRMANDEYRKLLRLGVVNSNVRLGDLTKLLKDTNFGESINSRKALRGLMRPLSKIKKWTEDMYTAEDDFWKITSYALERRQLDKAYKKYGITKTIDELDEEAADLIRNQIPNYDMVNDFIRATRKLPLGNFVSFPAEIMRTTANILQRSIKEINYTHTLDDGRIVRPLRGIGMKRAVGLASTVVAVPYATVEAAKAIYDVTEDEMQALRRFVPDWSKNSTLVPIRGEDGALKYIDFSHANAYDTMIRPITAMITGVQRGMNEGDMAQEVMKSMWEGTAETLSPFVSESIWTAAISDIFLRQGRTREGNRLWTEQTPWGEKMNKAVMHALKTQFPGSIEQLKRLDLAIEPVDILMKGKYDKYGQAFELGDELAGLAGLRAVKVDPIRAMKFKIADFRMGVNNARREFTSPLLRGGPVTPEQIVDRYKVASDALYKVQEKMFRDYYAARTLGTGIRELDIEFADRVSNTQLNSIKKGEFKPFIPSENIELSFRNNARAIGQPDPYRASRNLIRKLIKLYDGMPLGLRLPNLDNPFKTSGLNLPITNSPILQQGLTNSPVTPPLINVMPQSQQLQQTAAAGQKVFGPNDTVFGAA